MEKTAVIFGHTSGLGLALSRQLLADNYRIIGIARSTINLSSDMLTEITADISDAQGLQQAIIKIQTNHANFDVLIYAAGSLVAHDIGELEYESMKYLYQINVFAPMIIESHLLELIIANGADVVNITSSSLHDYYPKFAEYSSSKAALAKFTSDLRRRLQDTPARVMDLCPSGFTSNMYKNMKGEIIPRDESRQIKVEDLARLVCYTLSLPKRMEVSMLYVNRK